MNFNFYIFGNPGGEYDQYPNDYSRDIFSMITDGLVGSRYMIYRKGDLMYYVMVSRMSQARYIGLCVVFNKAWIKYSKTFFRFLKSVVDKHAFGEDRLLDYGSDGEIHYEVPEFSKNVGAYECLRSNVISSIQGKNSFGIEDLKTDYDGDRRIKHVDFEEPNSSINELAGYFNTLIIEDPEVVIIDRSSDVRERYPESQQKFRTGKEKSGNNNEKSGTSTDDSWEHNDDAYFGNESFNDDLDETGSTSAVYGKIRKLAILIVTLAVLLAVLAFGWYYTYSELDKQEKAAPFVITNLYYEKDSQNLVCEYYSSEEKVKAFEIRVYYCDSSGLRMAEYSLPEKVIKGEGGFFCHIPYDVFRHSETVEVWNQGRIIGGEEFLHQYLSDGQNIVE